MSRAIKDYNAIDWNSLFTYDPIVPTGLRWKVDRICGIYQNVIAARAGEPAGCVRQDKRTKYVSCTVPHAGANWFASRVIWIMHNGELDKELVIDHIDGNTKNNNLANLRAVKQLTNNRNASLRKDNCTGVCGVNFTTASDKKGGVYTYATANWYDVSKRSKSKHFSVSKLGLLPAFAEAVKYRQAMIAKLNEQGYGYTESHGQ